VTLVKFRVSYFLANARRHGASDYRRVMEVEVPEEIAGDVGEIGRYIRDEFHGAPEFVKVVDAERIPVQNIEVVGVEDVGGEARGIDRPRESIPETPDFLRAAFEAGRGATADAVESMLQDIESAEGDAEDGYRGGITLDLDNVAPDGAEVREALRQRGFPHNVSFDWRASANGRTHVRFPAPEGLTPSGVFKLRLALGDDERRVALDAWRFQKRAERGDLQGILFKRKGNAVAGEWHPASL